MKQRWAGFLLTAAILIRFIGINQSLWLDEATSAMVVKNYNYVDIVRNFSIHDFHPPLYYLSLKTWTKIFGNSELGLRSMSVLFSLIAIYLVYKMAGAEAGLLLAVNPLFLYYSQEARMYAMVSALLLAAIYFLRKEKWVWFNLFIFLSFLTFYGSIFLIIAIDFYLLLKKRDRLLKANIGIILVVLTAWPLIKLQILQAKEMLVVVTNWSRVLGQVNLKNILLIPMKFAGGRISFYPKAIYYLVAGIWSTIVFLTVIKKSFENRFWGFIFWITLLVGLGFSLFTPMFQYFRFIFLVPVMVMVIRKDRIITIGFLIFSLVYVLNPNFYREDWKSLSKDLGNNVYLIKSVADPIKYYRPKIKINDLRQPMSDPEITVIPYASQIHGFDYQKNLVNLGYEKIAEKNYREISVETWKIINQ